MALHARSLSMWLLYRMASATKISLESVVIPTKLHQPLFFNFPKRSFGKKRGVFSQVGLQNGLSSL